MISKQKKIYIYIRIVCVKNIWYTIFDIFLIYPHKQAHRKYIFSKCVSIATTVK